MFVKKRLFQGTVYNGVMDPWVLIVANNLFFVLLTKAQFRDRCPASPADKILTLVNLKFASCVKLYKSVDTLQIEASFLLHVSHIVALCKNS